MGHDGIAIGELSRQTGCNIETVRYYCQATSGEQASNDTRTHPPGRPLFSLNLCGVYPI
jgi:hypothetical protein